MEDGRVLEPKGRFAAVAFVTDELITKDELDLDEDIVLTGNPALLKIKAATTTGDIKVDLASGTTITLSYADVNEANIHVKKVYKTGTSVAITDFYLWQ